MTVLQPLSRGAAASATRDPRARGEQLARALSAWLDRLAGRVVLFRRGEWVFTTFGLLCALGAFLSTVWLGAILIGQGSDPRLYLATALGGGVAVVVGSWLLGQLYDYRLLLADPRAALRRPVFVSWGGAAGAALVLVLFAGRADQGPLVVLDALARAIFLGHAVGRLGCISYGCCFGRPTQRTLAVTYRDPQAKAVRVGGLQAVPLHPAALYEALLDLVLFAAINAAAFAGAPLGVPTLLAFLGYGGIRFAVESLRHNHGRMLGGRLSLNQLIALVAVGIGLALAVGIAVAGPEPAPVLRWASALATAPALLAGCLPCALVVFLGFSVHRGDVGRW